MDDATLAQVAAADPDRSTWLAANAGSGKTRVLTDRVARLLLGGTPPQNILCLTFTKAAAGEMQNRLFQQLGKWALCADGALRDALAAKGVPPGALSPDRLDAARRLFAAAIETPGGLKIQTIHAFCAALLRQFPLEARLSPGFSELDEASARQLQADILEAMACDRGADGDAVAALAAHLGSDETLGRIAQEVLTARDAFSAPFDRPAALVSHGLPAGFDDAALLLEAFDGGEAALVDRLAPALYAGKPTDQKLAAALRAARPLLGHLAALDRLEAAFLTGKGSKAPFSAKTDALPTKAFRATLAPADLAALHAWMRRVEAARPRRLALATVNRAEALSALATRFLARCAAEKARRGVLDFDDLILRARALLSDPGTGAWVLYKLDGGIDHILVDEAQDTSPAQWDVIAALAAEITAGAGSRAGTGRTLFVVGDRKQSIYSFQGADAAGFDRWRADFAARLDGGPGLAGGTLRHSFRSAPAVLAAVDAVFAGTAPEALGAPPDHRAFREDMPGRVDLWPMLPPEPKPDPGDWTAPVDRVDPEAPKPRLARMIAAELKRLMASGETVPDGDGGRIPLDPGHVLVLVRRRDVLFHALIRALKAAGIAVAGADRMALTEDLAVKDLMALLAFLALPEDDLSLACILRSPLFGWDEDALYRLAQPRRGYLWAALREQAPGSEAHRVLSDLRDRADYQRPYEVLERILTQHGGRERLLARLGAEREEAIDALLQQALVYEAAQVPSITGFVDWIAAGETVVRRQADAAGRAVRVMTVHGAKGLEADLVILPDCGPRNPPKAPVMVAVPGTGPTLAGRADARCARTAEAIGAHMAAQESEAQRLLYVALTRARSWAWICAAGDPDARAAERTWHAQVAAALQGLGAAPIETPAGAGLRHAGGDWSAPPIAVPAAAADVSSAALPDWAARPAPPPPARAAILSPSDLGGAKALAPEATGTAGEGETEAMLRRGRQVHLLLERLPDYPQPGWAALAGEILAAGGEPAPAGDLAGLMAEAVAVLTAPTLAGIFATDTLAEVVITAPLADGRRLLGSIDRLIVAEDRVRAIDFKTNARVPETPEAVPEGLLRQMAAYRAALRTIYPGRSVTTALLWTRACALMPLPDPLLDRAWAGVLDAPHGDP